MSRLKQYFIFLILILSSCASSKKLVYFQGNNNEFKGKSNYTPIFKTDDLLNIQIKGENEESTAIFNLSVLNSNARTGYTNGYAIPNGYLIDIDGNIDFPVIGKVKIAGLSRIEAVDILKNKLNQYINNPIVNIQIQNYKITVLGDVKNPGSYHIPNERITVLEAIGLAGDLNITGKRNNVKIIRDVNGVKNEYSIDLTQKDLFNSEVYYLNQNDVVYIQPNQAKINSSNVTSSSGIFISIASLLITTINIISK